MRGAELSYAVRGRIIAKYTAQLGVVLAGLTVPPLAVALAAGESMAALTYGAVIVALGVLGAAFGRLHVPRRVQIHEGLVIAALAFVLTPLVMTAPFVASGLPPIDAWFEAVSGVTTTGLTTTRTVEGLPASFLFTRSWMQWYGGLGIVALSLALRMHPGAVARKLGGNEDTDLVMSTTAHTRSIALTYCLLTIAGVGLLIAAGVDPWIATLHSFASVSTGGFSTSDASLGGIGGITVQYAAAAVFVLGALPLTLYPALLRRRREVVFDPQLRWFLASSATLCAMIVLLMAWSETVSWSQAFREGPFLALSAHTTTGFSTLPTAARSDAVKLAMIIAMFVGGCAGSTAGGIKVLRLGILLAVVHFAVRRSTMPPHAVLAFRLRGRTLEESDVQRALVIFLVGFIVVSGSWFVFVVHGRPPLDSLFEVVSATATVGLSSGQTSPELPALLKLVLAADMLLGRVEFIALLVVLYPRTWIGKRLEVS